MTPDALSRFRSELPDCDLAVYADFGSGTVLASNGRLTYPQEYLDALCACAAHLFATAPVTGKQASDQALFLTSTGVRVFLRTPAAPSEALCCICGPDADLRSVVTRGQAALASLGPAL